MLKSLLTLLLFFASAFCHADDTSEPRAQALANELRCLVCQNETLADSDAPLAKDLRAQIHHKILAGDSDQKIIADLTSRYGEFILFKPSLSNKNLILWFSPFVLLVLGLIALALSIFSHRHRLSAGKPLTGEEKSKLEKSIQ